MAITQALLSARAALDTIGVNTHLDFSAIPAYQNLTLTAAAINYLGIKNLRDCANNLAVDAGAGGSWQTIANATGCKFCDFMTEGSPAEDRKDLVIAATLAAQGILNFIEGGNENDNSYALSQGNSIAWTAAFQQQVFAAGQALGLPVINMSFGSGWTAANNWHGDYDKVGDLSPFCDFGNAHTYPQPGQTVDFGIRVLNADARFAAASRPVITTEIGWDNKTFSQSDAARFALFAILDGIKYGNPKTYFYALFDDGAGKFGLMNTDGTPKPAGAAIHNLTTILADAADKPTLDSLNYGIAGTVNDNSLLVERSDGSFQIALWNEVDPPHSVVVTFGATQPSVTVFDPIAGTAPVSTFTNATSITISLPTHPVIVAVGASGVGGVVPPPPPPPPPPAPPPAPPPIPPAPPPPPPAPPPAPPPPPPPAPPPAPPPPLAPNPSWNLPDNLTCQLGAPALALAGVSIADPWAAGHIGSLALNVVAVGGSLVVQADATTSVSGTTIHANGNLAKLNALLAGLHFLPTKTGPATVTLDIWDQAGVRAKVTLTITVT